MSHTVDLSSAWAVVTGASSGIGLAYARRLAEMRCNLVMISNQLEQLADCADSIISDHGVEALPLMLDLSQHDSADRVTAFLADRGITPLILINNAGIFDFKAVERMDNTRLSLYIDLHVRSVTMLTTAIGSIMARRGRGYILNMSSMSCWMAMPGIAMYASTKAYIRAFTRAYRVEMLDHGVKVMVACPGGIATDLFRLPQHLRRLGVRLGVLATPDAFARKAIGRLIRGRAQYINGPLNRVAIVAVASLPEWARRLGKHRLLDTIQWK